MKRGTIEHRKTAMLAERLNIPLLYAAGILESLFHWAARGAKNGDLSGVPPMTLARLIYCELDGKELLRALVETGWVDALPDGRLVIHDWSEHAEDAVHKALKRQGGAFADGAAPFDRKKPVAERSFKPSSDSKMSGQCPDNGGTTAGQSPDCDRTTACQCPACLSLSLSHSLEKKEPPISPPQKPGDEKERDLFAGVEPEEATSAESEASAAPQPATPAKPKRAPRKYQEHPDFASWFNEYPRSDGRENAARRYAEALTEGATPELLLDRMRQAGKRNGWAAKAADPRERSFIPMAQTWLYQKRWKDTDGPALGATGTDGPSGYQW